MTLLCKLKAPTVDHANVRSCHNSSRLKRRITSSFSAAIGLAGLSIVAYLWNSRKNNKFTGTSTEVICDHNPEIRGKSYTSRPTEITLRTRQRRLTLEEAIAKSRELIRRQKDEVGAPGMVVGVSVDGNVVWAQGFGYSDLENRVRCFPGTIMRIASISKSITMAVVAKLWENGKLDLDKPVQEYVPTFPVKTFNDEEVIITCRHLVSHLAGIRHYLKPPIKNSVENQIDLDAKNKDTANDQEVKKTTNKIDVTNDDKSDFPGPPPEYYLNKRFKTVADSLTLFQDDPLFHKPGEKYLYTTHGWTLVSAIVEKVVKEPFPVHITRKFMELGMTQTSLDINELIVYNRSRYYHKNKSGNIVNVPQVDNSYKWAGGGFQSTVLDLLSFANIMLYSSQHTENSPGLPGYLKSSTVAAMWTPVEKTLKRPDDTFGYGMGWWVVPRLELYGQCKVRPMVATHSGGAVGASSVLIILPRKPECGQTRGTVVAILTNLENVGLEKVAIGVARLFDQVDIDLETKD